MADARALALHPDRLLPAEPGVREVARELYRAVRDLPVISPHGHVDPRLLLEDEPFPDPATLLVTPDHYVTRLLHASGVPLDALGVAQPPPTQAQSRAIWRRMCAHWDVFRGTPVRYWLEHELVEIFGVTRRPSAASADAIYDELTARLAEPGFRPRALFERFRIAVLATTDDPCDDLAAHAALAADPTWTGRVIPTFRPDRYLEVGTAGWPERMARLAEVSGAATDDYPGFVAAMEARRRYFIDHGATSADHSHEDVRTDPLDAAAADRIYRAALAGEATAAEAVGTAPAHAARDGPDVLRGRAGDDAAPRRAARAPRADRRALRGRRRRRHPDPGRVHGRAAPAARALRHASRIQLVVFTLDETVWSRELAPLAGFYPALYVGAPWWFLDAPEAIRRYRRAVTETIGFSRTSGFIDDTRAFCSIPARHDMSRRLDAGWVAELVAQHLFDLDEATEVMTDLVSGRPTEVFKL